MRSQQQQQYQSLKQVSSPQQVRQSSNPNLQHYETSGSSTGQNVAPQSALSPVNQQILARLKQQQAQRILERRQYELALQEEDAATQYQQAGVIMPASGQFARPQQQMIPPTQAQENKLEPSASRSQLKSALKNNNSKSISQSDAESSHNNHNNTGLALRNDSSEIEAAPEHLLMMTIDLGQGKSDVLHIYQQDDPLVIAEEFCVKNNLTNEAMAILAKNIEENKQIVLNERQYSRYHKSRSASPPVKQFTQGANYYASQQHANVYNSQDQQLSQPSEEVRSNYYKATPYSRSENHLEDEAEEQLMQQNNREQSFNHGGEMRQQSGRVRNTGLDYQVVAPAEKQSIYDRLYNDAAKKEHRLRESRKKQEASMVSSTSTRQMKIKKQFGDLELNLGEYLYHKGQQMKSNKQQNTEEFIMLQMEKEKMYPFRPEINENSQRICMVKRNEHGERTEDHLLRQGQIYKEKMDYKKSIRETEQIDQCTFTPQVNPVSEFLVEQKKAQFDINDNGDKFENLFEESRQRNQRKDERGGGLEPECSFHPKITRPPKNDYDSVPVVERMVKSANDRQKKQQELKLRQKLEEEEKSEYTFTPAVGRAPKYRNQDGLPVHEYLYAKKEDKKLKQEWLIQQEQFKQSASKVIALDASEQIVERTKRERIAELFNQLDSDGDNQISSTCIDISQLSNEMIEFIAPVLQEMEESNLTIQFEEFYICIVQLLKNLTIVQREELFNFSKNRWDEKRSKGSTFEYRPVINKRSERLMQNRSPEKFERLYQNGLEKKKVKEDNIQQIKEQQTKKELSKCTFKPELFRPMKIYGFMNPNITKESSNFFGGAQHAFDLGDGQFRVTGIVQNIPTVNSIRQ